MDLLIFILPISLLLIPKSIFYDRNCAKKIVDVFLAVGLLNCLIYHLLYTATVFPTAMHIIWHWGCKINPFYWLQLLFEKTITLESKQFWEVIDYKRLAKSFLIFSAARIILYSLWVQGLCSLRIKINKKEDK